MIWSLQCMFIWELELEILCAGLRELHSAPHKMINEVLMQDWKDLWRPELAGRISMVNSPREVIGAVLQYMGASYNTINIDLQVVGGKTAVQQNLALLGKQVQRNLVIAYYHLIANLKAVLKDNFNGLNRAL